MSIKTRAYILTFFAYASVHMMRMTYSFNKHNIQKKFGVTDIFLGFLDALIFLSLSLGTLFRYSIINDNQSTLIYLKAAIPTSLAFSLVPMISLLKGQTNESEAGIQNYLILSIGFGLFGFCQFSFFPVLIAIFSGYFNVNEQGSLVGFWSSKSNAGNILGFFFANFFVYQIGTKWQVTMFVASICHILVALLLYKLVQNIESNKEKITTSELFQFIKYQWSFLDFKLYILSFSFFKAILYSYQLWTPQFLVDVQYQKFSGYVPMVFDISTLVGSFLMGKTYSSSHYKLSSESKSVIEYLTQYRFSISCIFIIGSALVYLIVQPNILVYFSLAILMGLFLGGVYNSLQNNEIMSYAKNNPRSVDLLSTVNIGLGSFLVGIFQIVIGIFIHISSIKNNFINQRLEHNHKIIYLLIAFLTGITMILTCWRTLSSKKQTNSFQHIQNINIVQ